MEKLMDEGYKLQVNPEQFKEREPRTEMAKIHTAKLFALAREDEDPKKDGKIDIKCPNVDQKYWQKWNVVNGVLVIGEPKKREGQF